jgi:hypothetical protein
MTPPETGDHDRERREIKQRNRQQRARRHGREQQGRCGPGANAYNCQMHYQELSRSF